jgi:hypothetical protein
MESSNIGNAGAITIANALPKTKLTSLHFYSCNIRDAGAIAIANALPETKLTSLRLDGANNNITAASATAIANVLPYTSLTSLLLGGCKLGDVGAIALATSLQGNQKLTLLALTAGNICEAGVAAIADVLPSTALTSLNLGWFNKIGPDGAKALATSLRGNQNLTSLILNGGNIGDDGAAAIADVLPSSILNLLNLRDNSINEKGAEAIATGLKNNETLTTLYLFNLDTLQWKNSSAIKVIEAKLEKNQSKKDNDIRQNNLHKLNTAFNTPGSTRPDLSADVTEKILNYTSDKDLRSMLVTRNFPDVSMPAALPDTNTTTT